MPISISEINSLSDVKWYWIDSSPYFFPPPHRFIKKGMIHRYPHICHPYFFHTKAQKLMLGLGSGNKDITEIMHNELNIFLLTNISDEQYRNNTKWLKQTGIWPSVKQSNTMFKKKNTSIELIFQTKSLFSLWHKTQERSRGATYQLSDIRGALCASASPAGTRLPARGHGRLSYRLTVRGTSPVPVWAREEGRCGTGRVEVQVVS